MPPHEPQRSDKPLEENPFASPQAAVNLTGGVPKNPSRWTRRAVLVLAVVLTPIASFIGGFCCCEGRMMIGGGGMYGPIDIALTMYFPAGAAVAGIGTLVVFARWYRRARTWSLPDRE